MTDRPARWMVAPLLVATLVACGADSCRPERTAATAKYTISQLKQGLDDPVTTVEGRGDFARVAMGDTQYVGSHVAFSERLTFGNVTYTRRVGEEVWEKGEDATTPEGKALVSLRNAVLDPGRSIQYLRSVSTELQTEGTEKVRGTRATHHRATVDLGREQGPPGRLVALEVWVDDQGRTRRLRYSPLGSPDITIVWELYDYGVAVDLTPPPPDKVK